MLAGKLIAFEGNDGAGKTTLVRAVGDALEAQGIRCQRFAFPGGQEGTIGRLVYDLHHRPTNYGIRNITPASMQTLHVAAHVDAIQTVIRPAIASGACVLLDRFWWSTWVYGLTAGVAKEHLRALIGFERVVWGSTQPEAVVHVTRPSGSHLTRLENEYRRLASAERKSVRVVQIANTGTIERARDLTIGALTASRTVRAASRR